MMDGNEMPKRIFLKPHDAALFDQKYGHPNIPMVMVGDEFVEYTLDALSDAKDARIAELEAKLLNIVSHATCGTMKYKDQSINDVSVQVTKIRNEIYEEGKKLGAEAAEAKLHIYEGRREAVDFINAQDRIAELEAKLAKALADLWSIGHASGTETKSELMSWANKTIAEIQGNP